MRIQALFIWMNRLGIWKCGSTCRLWMHSTPLCRFAALHTFCELLVLSNPRLKFHKGPTFSFDVYCCTQRIGWRIQRQSEKVNIRNACVLPLGAKYGRFCVLMNGRACTQRTVSFWPFGLQQQSTLRIGRTEVRIHLIWLSQIGSLFRRTQKPVRQQGVPKLPDFLPRGS